jgi:Sec-independent protein secretion pathway component TatC
MIKMDMGKIIKKWIPLVIIIFVIVITIGVIFGSSFSQIILSIIVSLLLILSAMFFRSLGGNRENEKNNSNKYNFDNDVKQ